MPLWAGRTLALLGIGLIALNLRTAVTVFSPIAGAISGDIPLDNIGLSIIGTLPPPSRKSLAWTASSSSRRQPW